MPDADRGEFRSRSRRRPASSLEYTRAARDRGVRPAAARLPEVAYTYTDDRRRHCTAQVNEGEIYVKLKPTTASARSQRDAGAMRRGRLSRRAGRSTSASPRRACAAQKPIQIYVRGTRSTSCDRISGELLAAMAKIPGVVEVESSLEESKPECGSSSTATAPATWASVGRRSRDAAPRARRRGRDLDEDAGGERTT